MTTLPVITEEKSKRTVLGNYIELQRSREYQNLIIDWSEAESIDFNDGNYTIHGSGQSVFLAHKIIQMFSRNFDINRKNRFCAVVVEASCMPGIVGKQKGTLMKIEDEFRVYIETLRTPKDKSFSVDVLLVLASQASAVLDAVSKIKDIEASLSRSHSKASSSSRLGPEPKGRQQDHHHHDHHNHHQQPPSRSLASRLGPEPKWGEEDRQQHPKKPYHHQHDDRGSNSNKPRGREKDRPPHRGSSDPVPEAAEEIQGTEKAGPAAPHLTKLVIPPEYRSVLEEWSSPSNGYCNLVKIETQVDDIAITLEGEDLEVLISGSTEESTDAALSIVQYSVVDWAEHPQFTVTFMDQAIAEFLCEEGNIDRIQRETGIKIQVIGVYAYFSAFEGQLQGGLDLYYRLLDAWEAERR